MLIEADTCYIQKNPLIGRKVIYVERLRESVWGWNLCDLTVIKLEKVPELLRYKGMASSAYDDQGLEVIPKPVFMKLQAMVRLYEATAQARGEAHPQPETNETMARCLQLLEDVGIIDATTYDAEHLRLYAEQYERWAKEQMERVAGVMDVHK